MNEIDERRARAIWSCEMPHWVEGDGSLDTTYVGWKLSPTECELIAKAIRESDEANAWRPIEEAVCDDTFAMVYFKDGNMQVCDLDHDSDPVVQECIDALTEDLDVETPVLDSDRDQTLADHERRIEELRLEVQKLQHRFDILDMAMRGAMQAAKERQGKKDDD